MFKLLCLLSRGRNSGVQCTDMSVHCTAKVTVLPVQLALYTL